MKSLLLTFFLWILFTSSFAQRTCDTDTYVKNNFTARSLAAPVESSVPARDTFPNEIITIPVVVHVLFNNATQNISDEQVLSQIEVLNKDFRQLNLDNNLVPAAFKNLAADARIMFCLVKADPDGRSTSGINRKFTSKPYFMAADEMKFKAQGGVDAWDTRNYLNIWVCSMFGRTLGYATPPGGEMLKDGLVINYDVFGTRGRMRTDFDKGRTTTHEVAHWLGLKHIWGDDTCGDDDVKDTPRQKSYNFGCPTFPRITNCSIDENGDLFMNFMDLTNDACMYMFTHGQKNKMRSLFALGGMRNSFLRSYKCDPSLATGGPLPVDSIPVVVPEDIIRVFPTPVKDYLTIQSKQAQTLQGKTATIFTITGTPVFRQQLKSSTEKINLAQLLPGMYMLSIGDAGDKKTFKVLKL
jgi:Pregnancy-associated plasma protein-A/Secretion system C-terminal sorting domain